MKYFYTSGKLGGRPIMGKHPIQSREHIPEKAAGKQESGSA